MAKLGNCSGYKFTIEDCSKGGNARKASLTSDRLSEIGINAINARWGRTSKKFKNYLGKYKITLLEYEELEKKQNNCCAICNEESPLVIDHDHMTGKVRGLLCSRCNPALGALGDNIEGLEKALNYLKQAHV